VPEQLLTILKICLLALLYLFFFRVLRAVWAETADPEALGVRARVAVPATAAPAAPFVPAATRRQRRRAARSPQPPTELVVVGGDSAGTVFPIDDVLLVGRAGDCHVTIAESFVSSYHARVRRTAEATVVEDLGSTNGTYVNRSRIEAPTALHQGDLLGVGNVELQAR